jgi:hypothetical protein
MPQLGWLLKRLRVMTARELLYRIRQQLTLLSLHWQYVFGAGIMRPPCDHAEFSFCTAEQACLPSLAYDLTGLREAAPSYLKGEIPVAGATWQWEERDDIWHRAPDTGQIWPRRFFAGIRYREDNPLGDIRRLWEPSRLQHLVNLAVLAGSGNDGEYEQAAQLVKIQLSSWVELNPPLEGAHYISAMECALRMIAACHALDILRDKLEDDDAWKALTCIVSSHAPLIEQRLSLYSSAGNHTVAEAAGLIYAGLLFPEMNGSERWLDVGTSLLSTAATAQVLADGGGAEQAFKYHLFNVQLLSLVEALLKHFGRHVCMDISAAVDRGTRFLEVMRLDTGLLPTIGDGDGGHALSEYLQLATRSDEPLPRARTFRDSGYTIAHIGSPAEVGFVFDHGPLGMPPSFGHGHADALSLLVTSDGEDVFVDPGTYTYTGDQEWRRYFRSTPAHNTITVDGKDQARQNGCFLWAKPYRARLLFSDADERDGGRFVADHDGYRETGVRHMRGIAWVRDQWLVIYDELSGEDLRKLDLHWHLATPPSWHDAETFDLQLPGGTLTVRCKGGVVSSHCGERTPMTGWRSPSYGTIEPITTVRMNYQGPLPHTFTTLIRLPGSHQPGDALEDALLWFKNQSQ